MMVCRYDCGGGGGESGSARHQKGVRVSSLRRRRYCNVAGEEILGHPDDQDNESWKTVNVAEEARARIERPFGERRERFSYGSWRS